MTLEEKIALFEPQLERMPGISVIHQIENYQPIFMTKKGLELFGLSLDDLRAIGENYFEEFFNKDFTAEFFEKLLPLLKEENDGETFTIFHQVYFPRKSEYDWFVSSVCIFHSEGGIPTHTLSISFPIGEMDRIPQKAEKLLAENKFSRAHRESFSALSNREKEILKFIAEGKKTQEIAEQLNISQDTVNSHKKSIKHKLQVSSFYEMSLYAHAFDLL